MHDRASLLSVTCALALAGCGEDLPENPTYFQDVQPILRASCEGCHGAEPADPKVALFRLDRYVKGDDTSYDVWDYAQPAGDAPAPLMRVAVHRDAPAMPPARALPERQRDILERWLLQGAPKGTRANRPPALERLAPAEVTTADQTLALTLRAWDDDNDGLVVALFAHDLAASDDRGDFPIGPPLGGGQRELMIDTGTLPSKRHFEIYAILDDGYSDDPAENRTKATLVPDVLVDHGLRGTAPSVRVVAPNGGQTLIGSATISWSASDPDPGDAVTIDLALLSVVLDGTETVVSPIATGIANSGTYAWTIPTTIPATDGSGAAIRYKIRVTAKDTLGVPQNLRADVSDAAFTIAHPMSTTLTWNDVRPTFVTYCVECHGEPARNAPLDSFRLDKYDTNDPVPPITTDQGVYEVRSLVYQRMIATSQMPPGGSPQPTAAERDAVRAWLLGGAPKGGSSGARPTFSWLSPTATDATPPVTLQWTAADAEGLRSGRIEYAKVNGNIGTGCASANLGSATWSLVADPKANVMLSGATTWADTITWTPPSTPAGYYCVRGTVVDTAGQTTTVVNAFGMR